MERFPWLLLFDKKAFFILGLASFLAVLTCISFLIFSSASGNISTSTAQEKRWPLAQDISTIEQMQLFGVKQAPVIETSDNNNIGACRAEESDAFYLTVPKENPGASVRALVISTQKHLSVAVIDIAGQQQLFSQGDTLTNSGGEITRILSDRVIIRKDGHCTALMFVE